MAARLLGSQVQRRLHPGTLRREPTNRMPDLPFYIKKLGHWAFYIPISVSGLEKSSTIAPRATVVAIAPGTYHRRTIEVHRGPVR